MNRVSLPPALARRLLDSHWRVLVTGAGGWLGRATLELLADALGVAWRERVLAFGSNERTLELRDGTLIRQQPLTLLPSCARAPSLLLHFAYLTRENATSMPAQAYVNANRALSRVATEGGEAVGVERMFVTSSGAVHDAWGAPGGNDPALLYGRLKLEDEDLFRRLALDTPERRTFVARVFNLSGPYINKRHSYALASFIDQGRNGHIHVRARHPVVRSYTSAANLLGVALGQLLADEAEPYLCVETAGDHEVEVGELARMVRDQVSPRATIERVQCADGPIDHYVGDGMHYRRLLARYGVTEHSLAQQIADTAEYLARFEHCQP